MKRLLKRDILKLILSGEPCFFKKNRSLTAGRADWTCKTGDTYFVCNYPNQGDVLYCEDGRKFVGSGYEWITYDFNKKKNGYKHEYFLYEDKKELERDLFLSNMLENGL